MNLSIVDFITEVRESFYGSEAVYRNGSCFKFAELLRKLYGGDVVDLHGHCVLRLYGRLYDIRGDITVASAMPQETIDALGMEPSSFSFYSNTHSRFDMVLDKVNLDFTPDQVMTLVARELQMLNFGHDLKFILFMVERQLMSIDHKINFKILKFDRPLTAEESAKYPSPFFKTLELNHNGQTLTFVMGHTLC